MYISTPPHRLSYVKPFRLTITQNHGKFHLPKLLFQFHGCIFVAYQNPVVHVVVLTDSESVEVISLFYIHEAFLCLVGFKPLKDVFNFGGSIEVRSAASTLKYILC